jgi:hypothetical protein
MKAEVRTVARVLKQLKAALGYYELGMNPHALQCLDDLLQRNNIAPFRLAVEALRVELCKSLEENATAEGLKSTARRRPFPHHRTLWAAVNACHEHLGGASQAANGLALARGAAPQA